MRPMHETHRIECIGQASKSNRECIDLSNFTSNKYCKVINLIHTQQNRNVSIEKCIKNIRKTASNNRLAPARKMDQSYPSRVWQNARVCVTNRARATPRSVRSALDNYQCTRAKSAIFHYDWLMETRSVWIAFAHTARAPKHFVFSRQSDSVFYIFKHFLLKLYFSVNYL